MRRSRSGRVPPGSYFVFVFNCETKGRVLEAACLSLCPTSSWDEERDAKGTWQFRFYPSLFPRDPQAPPSSSCPFPGGGEEQLRGDATGRCVNLS